MTKQSSFSRVPGLDGLRAVSIVLVLFAHLLGTDHFFPEAPLNRWVGGTGLLGVRIFFVISGFLITRLLLKERETTGEISLKDFYIRRVLRIFPVFYLFILVVWILARHGLVSLHPGDIFYASTFTMNYHATQTSWVLGHIWSLSVEEQFYLVWPLMMKGLRVRVCAAAAAVLVVIVPVMRLVLVLRNPDGLAFWGPVFPLVHCEIAYGCLLAITLNSLLRQTWFAKILASPLSSAALIVPFVINVLYFHPKALPLWLYYLLNDTVANWCFFLTIAKFTQVRQGVVASILNAPAVAVIGVLSYSLYIWQQLFLNAAAHRLINGFPVNLACAVGAAICSYLLLEKPIVSLRKRFRAKAKAGVPRPIMAGSVSE
jgi:peptidoglycan/LPS O-acetylase OafA/YrhL